MVSAINGKLTAQLSAKLTATPIASDFKVVQNINGKTTAVAASSVAYDEATKTVTLVVPELSATEVDQTVSYTVGYKETAAVASNSFAIAKVAELKAESAVQISSTQIKVTFNQKVTATTAENLANYKLGKAKADGTVDTALATSGWGSFTSAAGTNASLQEDERTVIITLGNADAVSADLLGVAGQFNNNTAYLLEVSTSVLPQAGKAAETAKVLPFTLNDSATPTVDKFAVNEAGNLVISFNEKLDATQNVKVVIDGKQLTATSAGANNDGLIAYSAATGKSSITFTKKALTDAKTASPAGFGLELGKTYAVSVADAEDAYGRAMNIYSSNFTYTTAAEAPKVVKVESKNEKSVTVTFSEPVYKLGAGTNALDGTSFNITKGAKHFSAPTVTTSDNTTFTITFAAADIAATDFIFDRFYNETSVALDVHVTDIKDAVGNITPASKHAVTVNKDTVKPAVVQKINKVNGVVDLTFNKALDAGKVTAALVAPKAYVLTSTGVKLPLHTDDVSVAGLASKTLSFDLAAVGATGSATTLQPGSYTLVIDTGAIVDTALNGGNSNTEIRESFVVSADGLVVKPTISNVDATTTAGNIVVTFAERVSYETAAKAANYVIDGVAIPAASQFALAADGKTLTITLPEATYTTTASKVIKINGVRNLAGTLMDEYENLISVKENEKIKLQSAKVVNGDIILTFNENVNVETGDVDFTTTDFGVKVNGVAVTGSTVADYSAYSDATKLAKNQIKLSAPSGTSFATGTVTVTLLADGTPAKDAAGNEVAIDGKIVSATR